jgi:hypothetical protein
MDYALFPIVPVLLERSSLNQSWGFRLQGGSDFRLPLSIKKVCTFHLLIMTSQLFLFI